MIRLNRVSTPASSSSRCSPCLAALSLALALCAAPASAEMVVVKEGRFKADVSSSSMSMISIVGEKVSSIRKMDSVKGPQMEMQVDGSTGQVFVGFDADAAGRSFSAFLVTESGKTVEAVLNPRDIEAVTIQVKLNRGDALTSAPAESTSQSEATGPASGARAERHESYPEVVTALIRLMFNDDAPPGVVRRTINDRPKIAGPFEMQSISTFSVAGLRGTVLSLHNVTKIGQPATAATFLVQGVLASAVSHESIEPGSYGRVYIVEEDQ